MSTRRLFSAVVGLTLAAALAASLAACGSSPDATAPTTAPAPASRPAPLALSFTAPAFETGTATAVRFAADISCGADRSNAFDLALPAGAKDVPLVIYLHGGGFIGGDKSTFWSDGPDDPTATSPAAAQLLSAGTAVASMNYRLLASDDREGVIKPMRDVAHCLQFIRYHAESLGIDPDRVGLIGDSAGAGTALWLGFHDDLADPRSADPVARMSTRPQAVAVTETQATYDIVRWDDDVFADYDSQLGAGLLPLIESVPEGTRLLAFYGIPAFGDIDRPDIVAYRHDVDMLGLMDAGDVPFWVANTDTPQALPLGADIMFHHPWHARSLQERAAEVRLTATATWGEGQIPPISQVDYVLRALRP